MEIDQKGLKRLMEDRMAKLRALEEAGINPYPHSFKKSHDAGQLREKFGTELKAGEVTKSKARVAGRVRSIRIMGRASFLDIEDGTGRIQLYLHEDRLGKQQYKLVKKLDVGDFLGAEGIIFKTKSGELSIETGQLSILAKGIRPLPSSWYGLKDVEIRYRQRALDLIMNPEVRGIFRQRAKALGLMREFLEKQGYLEVETPTLQPIYGGAKAAPFVTHLNALDMKLYLSISPELYLKRLIVGGFERVYTICKNFRNEGIDRSHNPEFTMMECYAAYSDYNDMMELTESMFEYIFKGVLGTTRVKHEGVELDFKPPWKRITMLQAIKKELGIEAEKLSLEQLRELAEEKGLGAVEGETKGEVLVDIFERFVVPKIIQPTFVLDHPKESSPLCKPHRQNPELIERFEPFALGMELGNAYTELNDPRLQRKLLEEQMRRLKQGQVDANPMDEEFLESLELGMPPTGGLGIGVDRMVMLLTAQRSIRDVILFPFMKKRE